MPSNICGLPNKFLLFFLLHLLQCAYAMLLQPVLALPSLSVLAPNPSTGGLPTGPREEPHGRTGEPSCCWQVQLLP
jgi:hypothetical protein